MPKYDRKDHLYSQAKSAGFRSRAYYKLEELDEKYQLISTGDKLVDLGAWPGGWMQYARKRVGAKGLVVGIDLVEIEAFAEENVICLIGDLNSKEVVDQALSLAKTKFDVLVSDMSPKLSGLKDVDRTRAVALADLAIYCAGSLLKESGNFAIKVFKGNETEEFFKNHQKFFKKLIRKELKSTRKTSTEFYIVGLGFNAKEYTSYLNECYS